MPLSPHIWISSYAAVQKLKAAGVEDPGVLGVWAHDGLLRSSAAVERIAGQIQPAATKPFLIPRGFWGELASNPVFVDWAAGVFETYIDVEHEYGWQHAVWRLTGVKFAAGDIETLLAAAPTPSLQVGGFQKALLPANARPSEKIYAPAAHRAAELMQTDGLRKADALRQSRHLVEGKAIAEDSIIRGIRRSFDRMYDEKGRPVKIDQN